MDKIAESLNSSVSLDDLKKSMKSLKKTISNDSEFSRTHIRDVIEQATEAIPDALQLAAQSQDPNLYQAASALIRNVGDLCKKLHDMGPKESKNPDDPDESSDGSKLIGLDQTTESFMKELQEMSKQSILVDFEEIND